MNVLHQVSEHPNTCIITASTVRAIIQALLNKQSLYLMAIRYRMIYWYHDVVCLIERPPTLRNLIDRLVIALS